MPQVLITADELAERLEEPERMVLLDVRWRLDRPDGRADYAAGHIPRAVYADLERDLSSAGAPADGRHPLPSAEALQESARRWGIDAGNLVVAYDDIGGMSAARAWWLLTDAGVDARLLDGGLHTWRDGGYALERGERVPALGNARLSSGRLPRLSIDEAAALPSRGALVDVRAPERFRGEAEPVDPQAGHIPGARNLPTGGNLAADGRFLSREALAERFDRAGLSGAEVGVYCGSGVTASHTVAAMMHAGYAPGLFPGSWSQWSNTPGRPVETGT